MFSVVFLDQKQLHIRSILLLEELELNQDIEEQEESSDQDEDAVLPNQRFVPREEISQDFGVSFPIDI